MMSLVNLRWMHGGVNSGLLRVQFGKCADFVA